MKNIKHIFLVFAVSLASITTICTQDIAKQMDSIFMNLDLTPISSNYLYDKSVSFRSWKNFDGISPLDSMEVTTQDDWFWHYTAMETARIDDSEPFTSLEEYKDIVDDLSNQNSIPLTLMMLEYHRLKPNALEDSIIFLQEDALYPNPNSSVSPFMLDSLFIGTSLALSVDSGNLQFILPDSLLLTNFETWNSIDIDFQDDVGGFRKVIPNNPISVTYSEAGVKQLTFRIRLTDESYFYAKSNIEVTSIDDGSRIYSSSPDQTILLADSSLMNIFYSDDCNKIQKPLIYVEGFNPATLKPTDWEIMLTKLNVSSGLSDQVYDFPSGARPTIWEQLSEEGYDLIFVDFKKGSGDVLENAKVVEEVIKRVNDMKSDGTSTVPNTIIAASMGGLVTYRALTRLEIEDYDHQVEDFISFDTPFRGVNIPLGLQAFIKVFGNIKINDTLLRERVPEIGDVFNVLNDVGTRQLLYTSYDVGGQEFNSDEHDAFQETIFNPPPPNVNHIAISNGSGIGQGQLLNPGEQLMKIKGDHITEDGKTLIFDILEVYAVNNPNASWQTIYKQKLKAILLGWPVTIGGGLKEIKTTSDIYPYDSAPGSFENYDLPEKVGSTLNAELTFANSMEWGFVPTVSALNIPGNPDPFMTINPETCGGAPVKRCIFSQDDDVWSPFFSEGVHNQKHVSVNTNVINFLLTHIFTPGIIGNSLNGVSFNFGEVDEFPDNTPDDFNFWRTDNVIDKFVNISNGGQLLINNLDKIGYLDSDNLSTGSNSEFRVDLIESCDPPVFLDAHNGGLIQVGEPGSNSTNKGSLYVNQNTSISISNESKLNVNKGSKLIIKSGGRVTIKDQGVLTLSYQGEVVIEDGGVLEFEPGARLRTPQKGKIKIKEGGELILNESVNVDLVTWESRIDVFGKLSILGNFDFSGNGYFKFYPTNEFNLQTDWKFIGSGKSNKAIHLTRNTTLDFGNHGFDPQSLRIVYEENSKVKMSGLASIQALSCSFVGHENGAPVSTGFDLENIGGVNFTACLFEDLDIGLNISGCQDYIRFYVSVFQNMKSVSINATEVKVISSSFCTYDGNSNTLMGMLLTDVDLIKSTSDVYKNYSPGYAIYASDVDAFALRLSTIENCEYGFFSPENQPSNVMLMKGTKVQNNKFGVHIEKGIHIGNQSRGLVLADCAKFISNEKAIVGVDLDLQLDAYINCGGCIYEETSPNQFVNNDLDIDVCFDDFDTDEVYLRGNYWGENGPDPEKLNINKKSSSNLCNAAISQILTTPIESNANKGCYTKPPIPPTIELPVECVLKVDPSNPKSPTTYDQYGEGYSYYRNEIYSTAFTFLETTAGISNAVRDQASDACRHYINVSRALIKANENGAYDLLNSNNSEKNVLLNQSFIPTFVKESNVHIYPNPTTGSFSITGLETASNIIVYDITGRIIDTIEKVENDQKIQMFWPSGLYILKITNNENRTLQTKRLVVH